jgi:hypothetical protein
MAASRSACASAIRLSASARALATASCWSASAAWARCSAALARSCTAVSSSLLCSAAASASTRNWSAWGAALGVGRLGLGGRGALLGGAHRLHLGLGGGRVGQHVDPLPQILAQRGDPVGLGVQRPQQLRAAHLRHRHLVIGLP